VDETTEKNKNAITKSSAGLEEKGSGMSPVR
jgi:hypothetical protein